MNTPADVRYWAALYPVVYDSNYYDPHIASARAGNISALERLTEWKNPGAGNPPTPTRLSTKKKVAFDRFIAQLPVYLAAGGAAALRLDFANTAPVYAIFWHHVLFSTPIFDVHTNRAFQFFTTGQILKGRTAAVLGGGHWVLYDNYTVWLRQRLLALQVLDATITERDHDRALMQWGIAHK
jgi:hypothetical protein